MLNITKERRDVKCGVTESVPFSFGTCAAHSSSAFSVKQDSQTSASSEFCCQPKALSQSPTQSGILISWKLNLCLRRFSFAKHHLENASSYWLGFLYLNKNIYVDGLTTHWGVCLEHKVWGLTKLCFYLTPVSTTKKKHSLKGRISLSRMS